MDRLVHTVGDRGGGMNSTGEGIVWCSALLVCTSGRASAPDRLRAMDRPTAGVSGRRDASLRIPVSTRRHHTQQGGAAHHRFSAIDNKPDGHDTVISGSCQLRPLAGGEFLSISTGKHLRLIKYQLTCICHEHNWHHKLHTQKRTQIFSSYF